MNPIENDPSARIQFRRIGELQLPATCYVCGNGNCEEGYLDFGTFVDFHGSFYLCYTCFMQAAALLRLITPEEAAAVNVNVDRLTKRHAELAEELEEAHELINHLNGVLGARFTTAADVSSGVMAPESEPEPERDPKPTVRSASGEPESEEPVKVPGRKHSAGASARNVTFASD